ncbi:ribosomal large subunit pseudouridine synthase A [Vibrio albensis VL426]|nr:ribosomal large subunit pseudouridine synthase A [Vibrio cholerae VL426]
MAMTEYNPPKEPWIDVIYEDEHIIAANKPSGLLSVPGRPVEHYDSMWARLVDYCPDVKVVHRLDMSTSGLILFAKGKHMESALKKQFQYRLTHKIYYARVWGVMEQDEGEVNLPIVCNCTLRSSVSTIHVVIGCALYLSLVTSIPKPRSRFCSISILSENYRTIKSYPKTNLIVGSG